MRDLVLPALVAAIVTLGIEYFAKPSLEARKERLMERHRAGREARRSFRVLSFQFGRLAAWAEIRSPAMDERRPGIERELRVALDEVLGRLAATEAPDDDLGQEALSQFAAVCEAYLVMAAANHLSPSDAALMVKEQMEPRHDLAEEGLHVPRWRFLRRRRIRTDLVDLDRSRGVGVTTG
jgi:hypothetical protein